MKSYFMYKTEEERNALIEQYKTLFLVEEQNIKQGNFLIFSDNKGDVPISYQELSELKTENSQLKQQLTQTNQDLTDFIEFFTSTLA